MALFEQKAPGIMAALIRDLGMADYQAAGVLGNIGHECGGFTDLVQGGAMVPNDMSGNAVGWPQWDGVRKRDFLAWCVKQGLDFRSDEANYRYLVLELRGPERAALNALLRTRTLTEATDVFEAKFERAGVPALASRRRWAKKASDAYATSDKRPLIVPLPPPVLQPHPPDDPGVEPATDPPPPAVSGGFFMAIASLFRLLFGGK